MQTRSLSLLAILALLVPAPHGAAAQTSTPTFLFDATKAEMAGSADWVVDADTYNLRFTTGSATLGGNEANPQQIPTPAASGITASTAETYWKGALSSFGVGLVKAGYGVQTLPYNGQITYGDVNNPQDLSHYKVYVVDEPNILFTASEKTAILTFVQNGGSLLMVADHSGSDRNNDGSDSLTVWNDLMTNNTVKPSPFGISFNADDVSPASTFVDTTASDPIIHGTAGTVTKFDYSDGATISINTTQNSTVKGAVWTTSTHGTTNVMVAYATFGRGRVVAIGDSSPLDDGTGDPNDTLYKGWTTDSNGTLVLNASQWLAATPAPIGTAVAIAAGPDGNTHILWSNASGAMTLWTLHADGSLASSSPTFGPYAGWTAKALSVGPDNASHVLWTHTGGAMTLWTLSADGSAPAYGAVYGPYAGWTAQSVATSLDGNTHVLWDNASGAMTLWTIPASGSPTYSSVFSPITGWTAQSIATDQSSAVHVLWDNASGAMTLWTVPAGGSPTYSPVFGPFAGWSATGLSVDTDNASHVLWDKTDGSMTLWTLPVGGSASYSPVFGPYAGWSAVGLSVGVSNDSHVLWDNADGRMTPWTLDASSQFVGTFPTYGPF